MSGRPRLGVLLSGRGSNFLALHRAIEAGELPAEIAVVISNRKEAPGLDHARQRGIPALGIPTAGQTREEHDQQVLSALAAAGVDWVCLAGYMRLLSPRLLAAYPRRIVNIHPSLLPAFPGLHAQEQALRHGVKVAGCTVHLVDEGLDSGPIVYQSAVEVRDDDTVETLSARILEQEHRAYPVALKRLLTDTWRVEGRCLRFAERPDSRKSPGGA